jgi:hypothetical protein
MKVSLFRSGHQTTRSQEVIEDWDELCDLMQTPIEGEKNGDYIVRGLCDGPREDSSMKTVDLIVIDGDSTLENGESCVALAAVHAALKAASITHVISPSYSNNSIEPDPENTGAKPLKYRWRALIPCEDITTPDELAQGTAEIITIFHRAGLMVRNVKENQVLSQPWYTPRCPVGALGLFDSEQFDSTDLEENGGYRLTWNEILPTARYGYVQPTEGHTVAKTPKESDGGFCPKKVIEELKTGTIHTACVTWAGWKVRAEGGLGDNQLLQEFVAAYLPHCPDQDKKDRALQNDAAEIRKAIRFCREKEGIAAVKDSLPDTERIGVSEVEDMTLALPDAIINPGGLISECMQAMRDSDIPDIPQYNFPVVLASIARAISGKATLGGYHPNLYLIKIGATSTGKSSSDSFMQKRLDSLSNFYGPSDFASGPALLNCLSESPKSLIVIDEATKMFRQGRAHNELLEGKKDALMELHTQTGKVYKKAYAKTKDAITVKYPCVSLTGNCTPVVFDSVREEDFETGLMQRIDFFCYDGEILKRGKPQDDNLNGLLEQFSELYGDPISNAMNSESLPPALPMSKDVRDFVYDEWSEECRVAANGTTDQGGRGIIGRRFESSLKYAMIHHTSKNGSEWLSKEFKLDSIQWGVDLSKLLAAWKLDTMKGKVTTGDFHKDCEIFKNAIKATMRAKRKERPTFKKLADRRTSLKNWTKQYRAQIIDSLAEVGEIEVDDSKRTVAYYLSKEVE